MEAEGWEAEGSVPADSDTLSPANLHRMMQVGSTGWQCAKGWGFHHTTGPCQRLIVGKMLGLGVTQGPSAMSWQCVQSAGALEQSTGPC